MKNIIYVLLIIFSIMSCTSNKSLVQDHKKDISNSKPSDTIHIKNEELEYEVIIIDGGYTSWLNSVAQPRGYYSENFLESRNRIFVAEWNNRFLQPQRYNSNLYEMQINYNPSIHYGYEVNYLIYNYLIYFQIKNKQQLAGFVPRP
ncbi:DUF6146 family protein [Flavobacterium sp.]|uniref:DUF6146 family protein n=1 Tax=Flavobacterium sp. TaxID=239 RepID=UPI003750971E